MANPFDSDAALNAAWARRAGLVSILHHSARAENKSPAVVQPGEEQREGHAVAAHLGVDVSPPPLVEILDQVVKQCANQPAPSARLSFCCTPLSL